jgi:glucokinase
MAELSLVGDIGGTNSRFGLVEPGSVAVRDIEAHKNDNYPSLEASARAYLDKRVITCLAAAAIAVAGPIMSDEFTLTNRDWVISKTSLKAAVNAAAFRLLNDFEALALSLPHLGSEDLEQIGGIQHEKPLVKLVLGPGTGLGMAALAPLPGGGWQALPGELGHITLPVVTREEFDLREAMTEPGTVFESEFAVTGGGLLLIYRTIAKMAGRTPALSTPEAVLQAALTKSDADAVKTLHHFIIWLARLASDAAMMMQAHGGVYLAGGIAPSIINELREGPFRETFDDKGRLAHVMRPIPIFVIVDRFPALKGCAASLQNL